MLVKLSFKSPDLDFDINFDLASLGPMLLCTCLFVVVGFFFFFFFFFFERERERETETERQRRLCTLLLVAGLWPSVFLLDFTCLLWGSIFSQTRLPQCSWKKKFWTFYCLIYLIYILKLYTWTSDNQGQMHMYWDQNFDKLKINTALTVFLSILDKIDHRLTISIKCWGKRNLKGCIMENVTSPENYKN